VSVVHRALRALRAQRSALVVVIKPSCHPTAHCFGNVGNFVFLSFCCGHIFAFLPFMVFSIGIHLARQVEKKVILAQI
jgi:F0F1-type ATP synthase assembly protein I